MASYLFPILFHVVVLLMLQRVFVLSPLAGGLLVLPLLSALEGVTFDLCHAQGFW